MKKKIPSVVLVNIVVLTIYLFCGFLQFGIDLINSKLVVSSFIYIFLSILLMLYFSIDVSYFKQKRCLFAISSLMLLLTIFRVLKYGGFTKIEVVSRHLWYLYYLPILFIPFFMLVASLANYYETHKRSVLLTYVIAGTFSLLLTVLILLNDLHQTAFKFKEGFVNWDSDYKHGAVYYIALAYVAILFIASFVVFFKQCQIIKGKRRAYLSLIPLLLGLIYVVLYMLNLRPKINGISMMCEFPETICFMTAGYILSLIDLRIIAVNRNYKNIFQNMSLPAFILDKSNKVVYQNADSGLILESDEPQEIVGNYLYQNASIPGGKITWISNISDLNEVYKELSEINDRLKEEEQLNLLISNLKEEQLSLMEKNKIYDEIAKDVLSESSRIIELSKEAKKDNSLFRKNVPIILLLSIYIKRFANLKLLSKENNEIDLNELFLSINELLRYLEKLDIKTAIVGSAKGLYDSKKILEIYSYIGQAIINNFKTITGVTAVFNKDYIVKLNIEGKVEKLDESKYASIKQEDDIYYVIFQKEEKND